MESTVSGKDAAIEPPRMVHGVLTKGNAPCLFLIPTGPGVSSAGAAAGLAHHQPGRDHEAKAAALAQLALHLQLGVVVTQGMLDDGQPQTGAAGLP